MSATLRIHRGFASTDRAVMLGTTQLGTLTDDVCEFDIPRGDHIISLKLGYTPGRACAFHVEDGDILDLDAEVCHGTQVEGVSLRRHGVVA